MYQCVLRGNGAQPFNGSREIITALVPGVVKNWAVYYYYYYYYYLTMTDEANEVNTGTENTQHNKTVQ